MDHVPRPLLIPASAGDRGDRPTVPAEPGNFEAPRVVAGHLYFSAMTDLFALPTADDADERPRRSPIVLAAAVLYSGVILVLLGVVLLAITHLASFHNDVVIASADTQLVPIGIKKVSLYIHDVLTIVAGLVLLVVMVRANQRLYRGSTSGRTTTIVLSVVLSIGCLMSAKMWGATVLSTGMVKSDTLDRRYMTELIAQQRAHELVGAEAFVGFAAVAVPLASLAIIILLNLPASRDYFDAMRRSGTY